MPVTRGTYLALPPSLNHNESGFSERPRAATSGGQTVMSVNSLSKDANDSNQANTREWGIYPAEPAARSSIVTPVSDQRPAAATDSSAQQCRYCTETLPSGARECPLCLREVADRSAERRTMISHPPTVPGHKPSTGTSLAAATLAGATAFPVTTHGVPATAAPAGAVYTLESPAQCPECDTEINT